MVPAISAPLFLAVGILYRRAVLAMELAITAPRFCAVGALYRRAVLAMVLPV
jgi:hypothetical protein